MDVIWFWLLVLVLLIIDEAGQALEPQCWIPLLKGKRVVLAGDHLQLPPTIHSEGATKKGLQKTLFEKVIEEQPDVSSLLSIQYRMNSMIMEWSSSSFYDNKIIPHSSVKDHLLCHYSGVGKSYLTENPLVIIDTVGCDLAELEDTEGSKSNDGEAHVVIEYILRLLSNTSAVSNGDGGGIKAHQISVISPYYAQVRLIRKKLHKSGLPDIEVNTVDGFQGREKDIIIISMVRSNEQREVGFLKEDRRMNVAVTRARRLCCIVCDSETVSAYPFLKKLVEYFQERAEYLSAAEFLLNYGKKKNVPTEMGLDYKKEENTGRREIKESVLKLQKEADKESQLRDEISSFAEDPSRTVLVFNRALSQVHTEIAEQMANELRYYCYSTLKKRNIFIEIHKFPRKEEEEDNANCTTTDNTYNNNNNNNNNNSKNTAEQKTQKPKKKPQQTQSGQSASLLRQPPTKHKPPEKSFQKDLDKKLQEMDEDELLEYLVKVKEKERCRSPSCKNSAQHIFSICEWCKEKYCSQHVVPEVHGCGDAVKRAAIRSRNEVTSNKNEHKLTPGQSKYLENKLQKKIEESVQSRSKKSKEEEPGGGGGRSAGRGRGGRATSGRGRGGR